MSYRKNVSDKQQGDIEQEADHSADRFSWFDGKQEQAPATKSIRAFDLQAQGNMGSTSSSARRQFSNSGLSIGSHNDKPARFETPGKA
jgi:hypothetical protein